MSAAMPRLLTLTRVLDAPRALVWQVTTDAKHLVHWMSAADWESPSAETDVREGGVYKVQMRPADGSQEGFWFEGTFEELREPERFVIRIGDGRRMAQSLEDIGGGKTRVVLTIEMAMSEEQERRGYGQILDKLEAYLRRRK